MNSQPLASRLEGKKIKQWTVIERKKKTPEDNSGHFSACYEVKNDEGEKAFLKAYNYLYAFGGRTGSADTLKFMTENFTYERDLLNLCSGQKMRRVVVAIDSGEYTEPGEVIPVSEKVLESYRNGITAGQKGATVIRHGKSRRPFPPQAR